MYLDYLVQELWQSGTTAKVSFDTTMGTTGLAYLSPWLEAAGKATAARSAASMTPALRCLAARLCRSELRGSLSLLLAKAPQRGHIVVLEFMRCHALGECF